MSENPWNELSEEFNTHADNNLVTLSSRAADNMLIAWPALLESIKRLQPHSDGLNALDFGCGSGGFCAKLTQLGYHAVGCDSADNMIFQARHNHKNDIPFYIADENSLSIIKERPFDLIASIMVFQFIRDFSETLKKLSLILKPNGVLAFAVHNPDYVKVNYGVGKKFHGFNNEDRLEEGYFSINTQTQIPVFIRDEEIYRQILARHGFRHITASKPAYVEQTKQSAEAKSPHRSQPKYLVMSCSI